MKVKAPNGLLYIFVFISCSNVPCPKYFCQRLPLPTFHISEILGFNSLILDDSQFD